MHLREKGTVIPLPASQMPIIPEIPDRKPGKKPTIDLAFNYKKSYMNQLYFGFECKKIDSSSKSTFLYVKEGMCRFVTEEKYSAVIDFGGMIAYVFTDISSALIGINTSVEKQLSATECLIANSIKGNEFKERYTSVHITRKSKREFNLHHLFLSFV